MTTDDLAFIKCKSEIFQFSKGNYLRTAKVSLPKFKLDYGNKKNSNFSICNGDITILQ